MKDNSLAWRKRQGESDLIKLTEIRLKFVSLDTIVLSRATFTRGVLIPINGWSAGSGSTRYTWEHVTLDNNVYNTFPRRTFYFTTTESSPASRRASYSWRWGNGGFKVFIRLEILNSSVPLPSLFTPSKLRKCWSYLLVCRLYIWALVGRLWFVSICCILWLMVTHITHHTDMQLYNPPRPKASGGLKDKSQFFVIWKWKQ